MHKLCKNYAYPDFYAKKIMHKFCKSYAYLSFGAYKNMHKPCNLCMSKFLYECYKNDSYFILIFCIYFAKVLFTFSITL